VPGRRRVFVLGSALGALCLAGLSLVVLDRHRPSMTPRAEAIAESRALDAKKAALAAQPPGRSIGKAASLEPASVHFTEGAAETNAGPGKEDGLVSTLTVSTPPFEIDRRYRSMEGPFATYRVRLDGGDGKAIKPRELWWWKGARIEILDENDRVLDQEFMCHLNLDVDFSFRTTELGQVPGSTRLLTLTQGELSFSLPTGRGVPVASDEGWTIMFQVLNHNRDGKFRVRQRLSLYFVRDVDLFRPIDSTAFYAAAIWTPVDKSSPDALRFDAESCHCCSPLARALEAPNNILQSRQADEFGRVLVGHWTVPPGKGTWTYPFARSAPRFDPKGKRLYATWTHLHPFATEARLSVLAPGCEPKVVARSSIESLRDGRTGLVKITSFFDPKGIPLPEVGDYEVAVDYDNTSGRAQDSMTTLGVFVDDDGWKRPPWAIRAQNKSGIEESCGAP
jgi:hypothetical protein